MKTAWLMVIVVLAGCEVHTYRRPAGCTPTVGAASYYVCEENNFVTAMNSFKSMGDTLYCMDLIFEQSEKP